MTTDTLLIIITAMQLLQSAISSRNTAASAAMDALGNVVKGLRSENNEKAETIKDLEKDLRLYKNHVTVLHRIFTEKGLVIPDMEEADVKSEDKKSLV